MTVQDTTPSYVESMDSDDAGMLRAEIKTEQGTIEIERGEGVIFLDFPNGPSFVMQGRVDLDTLRFRPPGEEGEAVVASAVAMALEKLESEFGASGHGRIGSYRLGVLAETFGNMADRTASTPVADSLRAIASGFRDESKRQTQEVLQGFNKVRMSKKTARFLASRCRGASHIFE